MWNFKLYKFINRFFKFVIKENQTDTILCGYLLRNEKKQNFCYDTADTPYYFDIKILNSDVVYFKAQCPNSITKEGFEITPEVKIPYHPEVLKNLDKIYPSMLGPGSSTYNMFSYKTLLDGYRTMFVDKVEKKGTLMCYFGSNRGPEPKFSYFPDFYFKENPIMSFFGEKVNHPNEKRGIAAKLLNEMGIGFEGRIVREFNDNDSESKYNKDAFISLIDYPKHISNYKYNLNISGYRKSIPYRFIYSFCVGTAIITDKLFVKWFQPFEKEVIETVDMGYLPKQDVDWGQFKNDIANLPEIKPQEIILAFEKKWAPKVFANYIVNTCVNKLNNK